MISRIASAVLLLVLASACENRRTFDVRGRVAGFGDDARTLIVEHEDVPGLMPGMTMPFTVRDTADVSTLRVRDAISFTLTVTDDSSWIANIRTLPDTVLDEHPAGTPDVSYRGQEGPKILKRGEPVPQTELLTHADTTLQLSELEDKAVVLTFIYTRCPLPDFCPLMSQNFARLQPILAKRYGDRVHLLSVSFDPENDTPRMLREYAERYTDDLSSWTFATADSASLRTFAERFGEFYSEIGSELVHNLVTVLIGPDGTIRDYWRGNDWTTDEVVSSLDELGLES